VRSVTFKHTAGYLWRSLAALAIGVVASASAAQSTSERPLRIVVGYAAGGPGDALARISAEILSDGLDRRVIVENRPGAGGSIAAGMVAKAPADGSTLLLTATADVINSIINPEVQYDIETSFVPIALVASAPNVLVVHPSVPVQSVKELIEYARSRPGALSYGSAGFGTVSHLAGAALALGAGLQVVHVSYKGTAAAQVDLIGGRLQFMFDAIGGALPNAKAGRVRALAITSPARWPSAPDIPTMAESGFPGFDMTAWFGLLAPAGSPPRTVARISEVMLKGVQTAEARKQIAAIGGEPGRMTPAEFARYIRSENVRWRKLFSDGRLKVEQ
jgi:tripartite-type tricarboxylate transporter receptor subunit TctC